MAGRKPNTDEHFWAKIDRGGEDECWNWIAKSRNRGYGTLMLRTQRWAAHRLAFTLVKGSIPDDKLVLHECGNTLCCNPNHLYLGTHKQNAVDRDRHMRTQRGEQHWFSKLSEDDVREIRRLYGKGARHGGVAQVHLAEIFGVDQTHISRIVRHAPGQGWAHVD